MRFAFPLAALTIVAGLSVSAAPDPSGEEQAFAAADLTFRVIDASTSNGVAGVTIRRAAAFEGRCPPVRVVTDGNGEARYRGPLPKEVEFDLVAPSFHGVRRLGVSQVPGEEDGTWKAMTAGPVAMRRKSRPHPMIVSSDRSASGSEQPGFRIERGSFDGVGRDGTRSSLSYLTLVPTGPEDGFVLADVFPDEIGSPLEAPTEGYRHAKVYLVNEGPERRTGGDGRVPLFSFDPDERRAGPNGNCVVFRHRTDKGFVYGAVLVSKSGLPDIVVNAEPGERSLETEVAE